MNMVDFFKELNEIIRVQGYENILNVNETNGKLIIAHPSIGKSKKEKTVDFIHRYINNEYDSLFDLIIDTVIDSELKKIEADKGKEFFLEYLLTEKNISLDTFIKFFQYYLIKENKDTKTLESTSIAEQSMIKLIDQKYDKYISDVMNELKTGSIDKLKSNVSHEFIKKGTNDETIRLVRLFNERLDSIDEAVDKATLNDEEIIETISDELYSRLKKGNKLSKVFEEERMQRRLENLFNRLRKTKYKPEDIFKVKFPDGIDNYTIEPAKKELKEFISNNPKNIDDTNYWNKVMSSETLIFDKDGIDIDEPIISDERLDQLLRSKKESDIINGLYDDEIFGIKK